MSEYSVGVYPETEAVEWPLRLFRKSVLKQRKHRELVAMLGDTKGLRCLDIGSDNGVISYLLRQRGGRWASADLDQEAVDAIRSLVGADVHRIDGESIPFGDGEFDCVVIVDFLEHIPDDAGFLVELHRILKPGGKLVVNVPNRKESMLRKLRNALGQTDEKHGHLRPGYTKRELRDLLEDRFEWEGAHTYSRFFSELMDTLIRFGVSQVKGEDDAGQKGQIVTGEDVSRYRKSFRLYSIIYPLVRMVSYLDLMLFFRDGYMLIARGRAK